MPKAKKTTPKRKVIKPSSYDHQAIEKKWQGYWREKKVFQATESDKPKKYILVEFPYPSGEGLHMGHLRPYTAGDVFSRYLRLKGFNVLYPIGWDAFGLPAENYAIKKGIHPKITTEQNIANARRQLVSWGMSFDWSREINTTDPGYYKWTQWIFLQFYKAGLAYEDMAPINWCPKDKTGLANEEVIAGRCERCGTEVERKVLRQWKLKITDYADKLLEGLKNLPWPEGVSRQQIEWVGRKEGAKVLFSVRGMQADIQIFTTRLDTIFGATFVVLSPEHPMIEAVVTPAQSEAVKLYVSQAINKPPLEREVAAAGAKTGVFTGAYALNPLTGEEIPVWVSDYVMGGVGTGAIMAVPAHDERDFEFAKAHDLPIRPVVVAEPKDGEKFDPHAEVKDVQLPFTGEGVVVDSGSFTGMHSEHARKAMLDYLARRGEGEKALTYKLRDWLFSRQRYWGEPIPVVHCPKCGVVPVPEEELPVLLPDVEKYEPTGTAESPLANVADWVATKCPKCEGQARRETNTMPQWAGSSWYWLRYADPHNDKVFAGKDKLSYWQPVDVYFGGMEHTTLHLLYSRFWNQFLFDRGLVTTSEPYVMRQPHGIVLGPDGEKMSKSRGNVVNPDEIVSKFGADTLRIYEMFLGPHDMTVKWSNEGIAGAKRFLDRVWHAYAGLTAGELPKKSDKDLEQDLQLLVNKVTADIEGVRFNTAIAALMEFSHQLTEHKEKFSKKSLATFIILLSPFAPHLSEELWQMLGNKKSVQYAAWPKMLDVQSAAEINLPVQVNGKVRDVVKIAAGAGEAEVVAAALKSEKVKSYVPDIKEAKVIYVPDKILNLVLKK